MNHTKGSSAEVNVGGVAEYLRRCHQGKEEGAQAEAIAAGLGVPASSANLRKLRECVEELRKGGYPICARPETGYYWGTTRAEIEETAAVLEKRGLTALAQAKGMREAIGDKGGQSLLEM